MSLALLEYFLTQYLDETMHSERQSDKETGNALFRVFQTLQGRDRWMSGLLFKLLISSLWLRKVASYTITSRDGSQIKRRPGILESILRKMEFFSDRISINFSINT
jgi:hypothetical protein